MITTQCLATFLVIWICPIVIAKPSLYVRVQPHQKTEMAAEDIVVKHLEATPDTHTNQAESYRKTTHTKENLLSSAGDKINADTDVKRSYSKKEQEHVEHKEGTAVQTNDKDTSKYMEVVIHKQIDGKQKNAVFDREASAGDFATEKRKVQKTASGAVVSDEGQRAVTKVDLSHLDSHVKTENKMADTEVQRGHVSHVEEKKSSTVFIHDSDPDNLVMAGDQDTDTAGYEDDYVSNDQHTQQKTPEGELSRTSRVVGAHKQDYVAHEHDTAAYHETPMHTFAVEDDEVDNDVLGQYTLTEDQHTEFKGKDGSTENIEEKRTKLLNTDRAEHTDKLTVQTVSKAYPETPLKVTMTSKIIDRDHYTLEELASGKKVQKLKNGGTRTVQVEEERKKTYNMDATPPGQVQN
ncbi:hypothetical protein LSTR_LSTR007885 [Laodelphax striatellus]|uniref:Uncharacterized protein n=1 Tax=Laodelphax striatellus TaxID=195883 RepID=A0A482XR13_LAOST|nr:hypothetical protein LSTR_LSTR007885 [Laodelphax striatellus]